MWRGCEEVAGSDVFELVILLQRRDLTLLCDVVCVSWSLGLRAESQTCSSLEEGCEKLCGLSCWQIKKEKKL